MADALRWMPVVLPLRTLRRVLMVLLMGLVVVQSVGQLHRVAHAHQTSSVVSAQGPRVDNALDHPSSSSLLARLWGDHSSLADCQLFDQTCPDMLWMPTLAVAPELSVPNWTTEVLHERFALFERFYGARGPPPALN